MKTCNKCGEDKPLNDYPRNGKYFKNACKQCANSYGRKWKAENKSLLKEINARNYQRNREAIRAKNDRWQSDNPEVFRVKAAARRAGIRQRTASWANDQLIAAYYKEAKRLEELTGIQFHVDHIIPLQGELVSGLHVETNLQLLPANENLGKSNRFDPETFVA